MVSLDPKGTQVSWARKEKSDRLEPRGQLENQELRSVSNMKGHLMFNNKHHMNTHCEDQVQI